MGWRRRVRPGHDVPSPDSLSMRFARTHIAYLQAEIRVRAERIDELTAQRDRAVAALSDAVATIELLAERTHRG